MNQKEYNDLYLEIIQDMLDDPYSELTQRRAREAIEESQVTKKRGRKKTTGRFDTRQELVGRVRHFYRDTSCSVERIANNCKVSVGTVDRILETGE